MNIYSDGISISLYPGTPDWIQLTPNKTLLLDTTNFLFNIENSTNLTIILKDATNAFSMYNMTIEVEPFFTPLYPDTTNISLNWSKVISVPIYIQSQNDVGVISWGDNSTVESISYNKTTSLLEISFKSATSWKPVWIYFMSKNSCNRTVNSEQFWIKFYDVRSPAITNTFGPITINKGDTKLFEVPSDLFTDPQNSNLTLSISNCIDKSRRLTNIEIFQKDGDENFILASSNDTFPFWIFEIYAINIYKISNVYQVTLNIIQWASKDWIRWNGPNQADCEEWK